MDLNVSAYHKAKGIRGSLTQQASLFQNREEEFWENGRKQGDGGEKVGR